jgi:hypothetical protein
LMRGSSWQRAQQSLQGLHTNFRSQ